MSINGQGHSLTLVKGHSDFKVKCLNLGLYTQVSDSGPLGPLVSEGLKNEFETALVKGLSVFKPLKFYCIWGVFLKKQNPVM